MKNRIYISMLFILMPLCLFSQKEANNWYFGHFAGINFTSGSPVAMTDGALYTKEGCATISDKSGNLLFYTDGSYVWNKEHRLMPNGTGLEGDSSATQSGVIVPKPGSSTIYYIFTVDDHIGNGGLQYSTVDMSLDGGLGDVSVKNVLLSSLVSEKLTAVKHSNGTDFWVIAHEWGSDVFLVYLVNSSGVGMSPQRISIGTTHSGSTVNKIGYLLASTDGTKLASAIKERSLIEIFDFDNKTGQISNLISIYSTTNYYLVYGVCFSPDGSKLYAGRRNAPYHLYQFDLSNYEQTAIANSAKLVGVCANEVGAIQSAPDGKLYVAQRYSYYLGVINKPNELGTDCEYVEQGVYLAGRQSVLGLPNFIQTYLKHTIQIASNSPLCEGDDLYLTANEIPEASYLWTGPKGFISEERNPVIRNVRLDMSGSYNVEVVIENGKESYNAQIDIVVNPLPKITLQALPDQYICENDSLIIKAQVQGQIKYRWSTGENSESIRVKKAGIYTLIAENEFGCIDSAAIEIKEAVVPDVKITAESSLLCKGDTLILQAVPEGSEYRYIWSNGETGARIVITEPGEYSVTIMNFAGCSKASGIFNVSLDSSRLEIISGFDDGEYDFGAIYFGAMDCRKIRLRNIYEKPIRIDTIYFIRNVEYSVPQGQLPLYLSAYESVDITVCFKPEKSGNHKDTLKINDYCQSKYVNFTGSVEFDEPYGETRCGTPIRIVKYNGSEQSIIIGEFVASPIGNELSLSLELFEDSKISVNIFNIFGQKVINGGAYLRTGLSTYKIDIAGISNGVYFANIKTETSIIYIKFIKSD